jgi:hypothetical protein
LNAAGANAVFVPSILFKRHTNTSAGADTVQSIQVSDGNLLQIGLLGWNAPLNITNGGNVGIGTTNPQYKLAVNGNMGAQDIIITNVGWSDYVFRPSYRLRPLSEVSQYIQTNGHSAGYPPKRRSRRRASADAAQAAGEGRGTHPAHDPDGRTKQSPGTAESGTPRAPRTAGEGRSR